MTKNKFAKILVPALLSFSLSFMAVGTEAPSTPEAPKDLRTLVTEYQVIQSIEDGIVFGENVTGKGEGIKYDIYELMLVNENKDGFKVGDTIAISWTIENYEADEWDSLYSVEVIKD